MKSKKQNRILSNFSDEALYQAWCNGDLHAANTLLERYQSLLLMMAYKHCKNNEIAKDISQNVWIEICKKAKFNYEIKSFKAYLYIVCRNKYFDLFRKNKNSKEVTSSPTELPDEQVFNLEKQIEEKEAVQLSQQFILSLPPLQKQCYVLYVLDEMSMEEIANQLGISKNQVRGRIDRAKKRMKNIKNKIL